MRKHMFGGLAVCLMFSTAAQAPPRAATDIPQRDIQAFLSALPRREISDKPMRIVDVGGYHLGVFAVYRPKGLPQDANQHMTKISEIYYMLEGSGTLVTGGTMPGAKPMSPGSVNLQAKRIEGGVSRRVSKGDVVIIPGGTPHQWTSQDGDLSYLIFRTDPEGKMPLK
jgi:mannose-6-phosphate isomerase-like protein (cupin superfamily)